MPFQPGQSGNPGGRPKGEAAVRAAAQEHCEAAIGVLFAALSDHDARVRIKAAEVLLDRGVGKPPQAMTIANPDGESFRFTDMRDVIVDPRDGSTAGL